MATHAIPEFHMQDAIVAIADASQDDAPLINGRQCGSGRRFHALSVAQCVASLKDSPWILALSPLRECLHPGINHSVRRLLVLRPMRNQAPAHQYNLVRAVGNNDWPHLPGSDVVAGHQAVEAVDDLEPFVKFFSGLKGKAAAQIPILPTSSLQDVY
jgi:hypothetical protein